MKPKYIDFYGGKTRANIGIYDLYPIWFLSADRVEQLLALTMPSAMKSLCVI